MLNEALEIEQVIESTRAQSPLEIVVVDGGSDDATVANAAGADSVLQSAPGRAAQQNLGAVNCSGDVILFLHADCVLADGAIAELATTMADESIVGGSLSQVIDDQRLIYRLVERGNNFRSRWLKWAYGDQGIFVRRSVLESLGGFPDVRFMEDLLMVKRLKRAGRVVQLHSTITTSARRWNKRGVVRQTFVNWWLILLLHAGVSPNRLAKYYPAVR